MNRQIQDPTPLAQTTTPNTTDRPGRGTSRYRWWVGLFAILALMTTSAALAYPPDPWVTYVSYFWEPSDNRPEKVVGSNNQTCHDFSRGSVCAEFRSTTDGHVAGMCCIDADDLWSADPEACLVGATYQRDGGPEE